MTEPSYKPTDIVVYRGDIKEILIYSPPNTITLAEVGTSKPVVTCTLEDIRHATTDEQIRFYTIALEKSTELKKGDLVIINEVDRPDAQHICKIIKITKNQEGEYEIIATYIFEDTVHRFGRKRFCSAIRKTLTSHTPTPISHFGVDITMVNYPDVRVEVKHPSIAQYDDGGPRQWQGKDSQVLQLRSDYVDVFGSIAKL